MSKLVKKQIRLFNSLRKLTILFKISFYYIFVMHEFKKKLNNEKERKHD